MARKPTQPKNRSTPGSSVADLEKQLEAARMTISTDSYPMSIGELTNLYRDGELIIRPAFQRLFRWGTEQKSNLVESILLGIPLPSIFVSQAPDGKWELIDGLQRVSTILQLQGLLPPEEFEPLVLGATKYLKALDGLTWAGGSGPQLSDAQKLDVKRSKMDVKIIRRESSEEAKYDLFQRLNSYGSPLSAQEVRNAILVGVNPDFVEWLQSLAKSDEFTATTLLSDTDIDSKYDEELVLRFLWLHCEQDTSTSSLSNFQGQLEEKAIEMAKRYPKGSSALAGTFHETFKVVQDNGGSDLFRKWNPEKQRFQGGFLNTAFEVLAMGLGYRISRREPYRTDLQQVARELWSQSDMTTRFATGKATDQRLAIMLPKGRVLVAKSD